MASVEVIHGDMREVLGRMVAEGKVVQSVVTDAPYHLTNRTPDVKWCADCQRVLGGSDGKPAQCPKCGGRLEYQRSAGGRGFMGKQWDGGDIAFQPGTWRLCFELLPPGGHLLAFAGTRTYHRMAVAIEEAGFEIRDTIAWLYGSGFPKSLNVSKAIDKRRDDYADIERVRSWLEQRRQDAGITRAAVNDALGVASNGGGLMSSWTTNQTSHAVPQWEQWLQLKTLLAFGDEMDGEVWRLNDRKGTPGEAWAEREVIGQRVNGDPVAWLSERDRNDGISDITAPATEAARQWDGWGTALKPAMELICVARKPLSGTVAQTVLKHGTGAINIDGCRIAGIKPVMERTATIVEARAMAGASTGATSTGEMTDVGRWPANVCHDGSDEVVSAFPETSSPQSYTRAVGSETASKQVYGKYASRDGGINANFGDSGSAARFFYSSKADADDRLGSKHPTVKPVDLMRWLVRLITPPGGICLDPFAGSGTTGMACMAEGFDCILIEREAEYVADIKARIAHVTGDDTPLFADKPVVTPQQLVLL